MLVDPQQRARYDANPDGDLNDFEVVFEDDDDELFPEFFFSFSGRGAGRYSRSAFRDLFAEMLFRRVFDEDDDRRKGRDRHREALLVVLGARQRVRRHAERARAGHPTDAS